MYRNHVKRLLDIACALAGFPLFIVIFIVVAPLIFFEDRGPVFYNALRLGKDGKLFKMYKFRTMHVNAPDLRNTDGTTFNSAQDTRVTKIGRILRKTSLDEIPQILNVLTGDMSFVGPRPDLPDAQEKIYRPGDERKLLVHPGITGYSQAYYRNSSTLEQRFDGDVYYVGHMSFLFDLKIVMKTIVTVLSRKNVYRSTEKE